MSLIVNAADHNDYSGTITLTEEDLYHYGILRKSGRYPWGSGESQSERNGTFLSTVDGLKRDGLSDVDIAKLFNTDEAPFTTSTLRALRSIAVNEQRNSKVLRAQQLKDKGYSNVQIGNSMGINESSVRSLLVPGDKDKADNIITVSNMLRDQVKDKTYVDVGAGNENYLGISSTKLKTSLAVLKEDGYEVINVQVPQLGTKDKTTVKVLCPPGTTYRDVNANQDKIQQIQSFSEDGGRTMLHIHPPIQLDSSRVKVAYKNEGGAENDGVLFVRPGVEDVSFGPKRYAQVRVAVDGTHYMKGMAVYRDDLPKGVDVVYNSNKENTGNKLDAMKKLEDDQDNPFGSIIRQRIAIDSDGKEVLTSAMNIVGAKEGAGEEGGWDTWSKSLSTQLLSKQSPMLAQQQLDVTYEQLQEELGNIKALTNPTVRRKLLEGFSDGADASAVRLAAAALPRQRTQVILPVNSLKDNEVYAPNFRNGETVALIRYPHGGTFEIPELKVNNNHPQSKALLGNSQDAIGINTRVAAHLSGADFDGDTVLVIPNSNKQLKSTPALEGLKNFDPQRQYKAYDGMPKMSERTKGIEMGKVSNLITDMTIQGASRDELARAVRHSMVVIDAAKHHLNYRQSYQDNGIKQLYVKYQNKPGGGGATLISTAKSKTDVPDFKLRKPQDGGHIDPKTGRLVYEDAPQSYTTRDGVVVIKTRKEAKLAVTDDAHNLSSGTQIESIYAEHSNRVKALANDARKEIAAFVPPKIDKSAKQAYGPEVASLNEKLNVARKNKPRERQAQLFANAIVAQKQAENPGMEASELKKIKSQALATGRARTGAAKTLVAPTDKEWAAIQSGAVSQNQLRQLLDNADIDRIKELATPRTRELMTPTRKTRAQSMLDNGYTQAEVADALGVSLSTLKSSFKED